MTLQTRPPVPLDPLPEGDRRPEEILVASYNVQKCVGIDLRRDPARTMRVISEIGADILAIQEGDRRFGSREGLLDLDALHRDTGLAPVPLRRRNGGHGWHGNILLTRNARIEHVRQLHLPGLEPRGALIADLSLHDTPLRVVAAHLGLLRASRERQAAALVRALGEGEPRITLLLGDLNEWRHGGRSSLGAFAPVLTPAPGRIRSFPAPYPLLSLDRIYVCSLGSLGDVETHESALARVASDHLPVKARLRLSATPAGATP